MPSYVAKFALASCYCRWPSSIQPMGTSMPPSAVNLPHLKTYNTILDCYTLEKVSTKKGTVRPRPYPLPIPVAQAEESLPIYLAGAQDRPNGLFLARRRTQASGHRVEEWP